MFNIIFENDVLAVKKLIEERRYDENDITEKEKEILSLIADGICTNKDLQDHLNVNKGCLSIYKKKLSQEGLLNTSIRGKSELALPRFDQFIQMKKEREDE